MLRGRDYQGESYSLLEAENTSSMKELISVGNRIFFLLYFIFIFIYLLLFTDILLIWFISFVVYVIRVGINRLLDKFRTVPNKIVLQLINILKSNLKQ